MSIKLMYADSDYLLEAQSAIFGISLPVMCSYWVTSKTRGLRVKVTGAEKAYLLATIQHYTQFGGTATSLYSSGFFRDFCQAISARGSVIHQYFFTAESAQHRARSLRSIYLAE